MKYDGETEQESSSLIREDKNKIWGLKFSPRWLWTLMSSGMWRHNSNRLYRRFGRTCCLHLHEGKLSLFVKTVDEGSMFLKNCKHLLDYMASNSRRQYSSRTIFVTEVGFLTFLVLIPFSGLSLAFLTFHVFISSSFYSVVRFLHTFTGTYHFLHCNWTIPVTHVSPIMTNRKLQKRCHGYIDGCHGKKTEFTVRLLWLGSGTGRYNHCS
jgi:hypothetical protein